jgi:hypothetical protein
MGRENQSLNNGAAGSGRKPERSGIFRDRIKIHTAKSGTQSISVLDLLLDEKVEKDMQRLNEILTKINKDNLKKS